MHFPEIKKIFIQTLGCPKNETDSREFLDHFIRSGYQITYDYKDADIIITNTCSFIHDAKEESIQSIFETVQYAKNEKRNIKMGVIGCLPALYQKELEKEIPEIDFFWGANHYDRAFEAFEHKFSRKNKKISLDKKNSLGNSISSYAYIRTSRGCSRKCSFCSIPRIRGPFQEWNVNKVQDQIRQIQNLGPIPSEIVLVAQDTISSSVNEYRKILDYLSALKEVQWIRIMYLFPDKNIFSFLNLWKEYNKLVSYMDIPFQHISNKMLRKMNRPGDADLFREIIHEAVSIRKNAEIRSTFLLGFPEETSRDIEEITHFISEKNNQAIQKMSLFRYSHEEYAPAYNIYKNFKEFEHINESINELRNIHLNLRTNFRNQQIGNTEKMIIDRIENNEVIARREQDAPEIDEVVYIEKQENGAEKLSPGEFLSIKLSTQMEYDWTGEYQYVG